MWSGKDSKRGNRVAMTISELRVQGEDGVVLAASLSLPERTPAPALVALHGAQPGLRDFPLFEHLHATLPPAGVAVVTFDRRGEGASTGEPSAGRFEVLAADANAVVETVAALDEIDARRVGLWGSARAAGSRRSRRCAATGPRSSSSSPRAASPPAPRCSTRCRSRFAAPASARTPSGR